MQGKVMALTLLLNVFYYSYIVIKNRLSKLVQETTILILLSITLTIPTGILAIIVLFAFYIYRQLVEKLIKIRLKDSYVGLLEGIESCMCNQNNCIPSFLIFLEYNKSFEELFNDVEAFVERLMETKHQKLFYSYRSLLGYYCFVKNNYNARDYIKVMQFGEGDIFTQRQISDVYMAYNNNEIPNGGLFQILICPQKVCWNDSTNNVYTIMFRVHHAMADGRAMFHLFMGVFADKHHIKKVEICSKSKNHAKKVNLFEATKKLLLHQHIKDFASDIDDNNLLSTEILSEEKHIVWFSDRNSNYMDVTRKLRKSVKGLTFLDIINTGLSCSLYDYFEEKTTNIPRTIAGGVVLSPEVLSFSNYGLDDFELCNRFSGAVIHLPINIEYDGCNKIVSRLKYVMNQYSLIKQCVDVELNYWIIQNIFALIPYYIYKWMEKQIPISIGISSIPGCDDFTMFGGNKVKEFIIIPPNSPRTGVHILVNTYKGHLRLIAAIDKFVIEKYEDAQNIIDRCMMYIDKLKDLCESNELFS